MEVNQSKSLSEIADETPTFERVNAIDTLRGIAVMYSICELEWLVAFDAFKASPIAATCSSCFQHSNWHGFTLKDFGIPAFLLIIGVSLSFAIAKAERQESTRSGICQDLLIRSCLLFVIGFFLVRGFTKPWPYIRFVGVLQRIACCLGIAGTASVMLQWRGRLVATCGVLLGYWSAVHFDPISGHGPGDYSIEGNLVCYVDRILLGGVKDRGDWDTFGLVGTIPSTAICVLGTIVGDVFISLTKLQRLPVLLLAGLGLCVLAYAASFAFPNNRYLWTPPFFLYSVGIGAILLGVVYHITDVWGVGKWTFPFVVVGRNALFAFAVVPLLPLREISERLIGGDIAAQFGSGRLLLFAGTDLAIALSLGASKPATHGRFKTSIGVNVQYVV